MRKPTHRAVYIRLPDAKVAGELLKWLYSREHGWYGYVTWTHRKIMHTEPVPADRIERYPFRPAA